MYNAFYTATNFRNLLNLSCMYDIQTTYIHRIWLSNLVPIMSMGVFGVCFLRLKSLPSIGDPALRPVGQVMTKERMERDWLLLAVMKYANMTYYFLAPTVSRPSRNFGHLLL